MAHDFLGMKLRCRDGHWEMADFALRQVEGGYEMWLACEAGEHANGHWLAADPADTANSGRVVVANEPYRWPSAVEAFAARDRYYAQ